MRFITSLTTFLAASVSVVLASPINLAAPTTNDLVSRQTCQIGVPCFVQQSVTLSLSYLNGMVNIYEKPIEQVVAEVTKAAAALVKASGDAKAGVEATVVAEQDALKAAVVAAISVLVGGIRSQLVVITGGVAVVTPQLTVAVDAVTSAIAGIEAVVGPCV